jgi:hypothetical protein
MASFFVEIYRCKPIFLPFNLARIDSQGVEDTDSDIATFYRRYRVTKYPT